MQAADAFSYGDILDEVRALRWPARTTAAAVLPGRHLSRRHGSSAEFTEYRPYRQGDPVQKIDWKLFARTDRAYVRLSNDQAVLPTVFVVDASGSMAFPARTHDKHVRASKLALGLASVAHNSGDPVGVIVVTGAESRTLAPRSRAGVVQEIARTLRAVNPAGTPRMTDALASASRMARRVVVISDMLGDLEETLDAARTHRARASELYALHILAAEELEPPRLAAVEDPEDAALRRTLSEESRSEYLRRFGAWRAAVASSWRATGVSYHESITGSPLVLDVRRIVARTR